MIGININWQLTPRQLRLDKRRLPLRYKAAMNIRDKPTRTAATEIGARILEVIGDDSYETAAARVQQRGGKVTAPAMHKWVQGTGEITEPNIRAFCEAYGVSPAWVRYGVGERSANAAPRTGLVESLPKEVRGEAIDFIGYLLERKQTLMAREQLGRYVTMIERIQKDLDEKRNGQ